MHDKKCTWFQVQCWNKQLWIINSNPKSGYLKNWGFFLQRIFISDFFILHRRECYRLWIWSKKSQGKSLRLATSVKCIFTQTSMSIEIIWYYITETIYLQNAYENVNAYETVTLYYVCLLVFECITLICDPLYYQYHLWS